VYKAYCKNIVVLIFTLACGTLYGQQPALQRNPFQTDTLKNKSSGLIFSNISANGTQFSVYGTIPRFNIRVAQSTPVVAGLQKDLYIKEFGFFCKKEMQIEKSIKLPLRFRLGSLEQCNILEQKY
jgi:hypothetical protein